MKEVSSSPAGGENGWIAGSTDCLIINRQAGRTAQLFDDLLAAARELRIEPQIVEAGTNLEQMARDLVEQGARTLAIAGGDGSLAAAASVTVEHGIPLVAVPTGTLNHFALDVGLPVDRPLDALKAFHGHPLMVDVGRVNGRLFLNSVSLGVYADLVDDPDYRRHKLSVGWHKLHEALSDPLAQRSLRLLSPGEHVAQGLLTAVIANNPHTLRGGPRLGRRKRLDTGLLQVIAVPGPPLHGANRALAAELGLQPADALRPRQWLCQRVTVEGLGGEVVHAGVDGEAVTLPASLTAWSEPTALQMLVPPGHRPQVRRRAALGRAVERLVTWLRPPPMTIT